MTNTKKLDKRQQEMLVPYIVERVGEYYGFDEKYAKAKTRKKLNIRCKHVCMFLLREYAPSLTIERTAQIFDAHHASLIHAVAKIRREARIDQDLEKELLDLRYSIEARIRNILGSPLTETEDGFKYIDLNNFTSIQLGKKYLFGVNLGKDDLDHLSMIFGELNTKEHRDTGIFVFEREKP